MFAGSQMNQYCEERGFKVTDFCFGEKSPKRPQIVLIQSNRSRCKGLHVFFITDWIKTLKNFS